jgi:hypothetical protein
LHVIRRVCGQHDESFSPDCDIMSFWIAFYRHRYKTAVLIVLAVPLLGALAIC